MAAPIISAEVILNVFSIGISLLAVVYWVKLYRQLYKQDEREIMGWRWIFAAVVSILLFNITSIYLLSNVSDIYLKLNVSKIFPNARNPVLYIDIATMELFNVLGRTIIGLSMTVGAYLLYAPMQRIKGAKYRFVPVVVTTEPESKEDLKYQLESGLMYIIKEERPVEGSKDYLVKGAMPNKSMKIFIDLVTHGVDGLCISRTHPQKIRDKYALRKIPVIWLSRSSEYKGHIEPSDLVELSQTLKEFIGKSKNSVVLLDGIEYLITQNNFDEILRFIQSLNDTFAISTSRLIVPIDPSTIDEKQIHLLEREMNEITSIWKT